MELLTMTARELDRIVVLQQVRDGYRTQAQAALDLAISERQLRRILRAFERDGPPALISKRRGKAPNNRIDRGLRAQVLEHYRNDYHDFGPTLLAQALSERNGIDVSREWLRNLLIENKLWKRKRRRRSVHPLRERRPCFGELVQMDGSPHDWFEERGPRCTLLVAIDDATSRVTAARFELAETTDAYFALIQTHLEAFGRFCAAYTDKHSIFRYSGTSTDGDVTTQLQRALDELDISLSARTLPRPRAA
jgi:transposase